MTAPRFFTPGVLARDLVGRTIALPVAAAHHATRVVRLKPGDALRLFDGSGGEYAAVLTAVEKRGAEARIERFDPDDHESPFAFTLVQAVAANDAMDYAVRKAVELGVFTIQPVATERSAPMPDGTRAERRVAHWQQIAVSASEQSGRNRVPCVHAVVALQRWLAASSGGVLAGVPGATVSLASVQAPEDRRCAIVVGPEGGFSDREVALMAQHGVTPVALGPRVLRTETAAAAMLAILQARWGDLK